MNMHENHGYAVPTYQSLDADWFHFLHGNVPGHQIDFIYRAEVPQGPLTRQHFSHLARLMKYIEPRLGTAHAFAIGNLSRDDTQYEPGHGGIALIFGLRVKGAVDHAGRQDPPFCHAVACVDRQVDTSSLHAAAVRFHEQLLQQPNAPTDGCRWYQSYVATAHQSSWSILSEMQAYVGAFTALPALGPSNLGLRWTVEGMTAPKRVVIVYPEQSPFAMLAYHMARIASVLVESDLRWTAISTGREQDLLGGTSVRFVSDREAVQEANDVVLMHINQLPNEPADIARLLFGAHEVRLSQTPDFHLKWRHLGEPTLAPGPDSNKAARPWAKVEEPEKPPEIEPAAESSDGLSRSNVDPIATGKKRRSLAPTFVIAAVVIFVLSSVGLGLVATNTPGPKNGPVKSKPAAPSESLLPIESGLPASLPERVWADEQLRTDKPVVAASASASSTSKKRGKPGKTNSVKAPAPEPEKAKSVLGAEYKGGR